MALADPIMALTEDEWLAWAARDSLQSFARRMVPGYIGGAHIDRLTEALEAVERGELARLIVTMPPRHSKSLNVSENFPAWYLGRNPSSRIIAASHTAQLAYTFSRRVRNKIADPAYPFTVTVADDKGAVQAWDTDRGGGYIAVGAGGSPTGHGGNGIIIDDPIRSASDADSEVVRASLWEWYQGTMRTRLQPGGWIILTATRWHEDDLTGRLLAEMETGGETWHHIHMPAISDAGEALWPDFWSLDDLAKIRQSVGTRVWEGQYQGRPVAQEGGILKRHWFGTYQSRPHAVSVVQSWDTAFKTGTDNDYSVCATIAYDGANRYILDVYRDRLEYPDLERMVPRMAAQWRPDAVLIEDKASGQSLLQSIRKQNQRLAPSEAVNVIPIAVPSARDWKITRVNVNAPIVEAGRVHLPEAATWLGDTIHELTSFPLAAHDDIVDAIMQGLSWIETRTGAGHAFRTSWLPDDDDRDRRRAWR